MTVKDFMKKTIDRVPGVCYQAIRPRAVCSDGFSVSIQASYGHYCYPRENFLEEYDKVELGYPNDYMGEEFDEYAEDFDDEGKACLNTVYGYVPIEIVEKLIAKHGGIKD